MLLNDKDASFLSFLAFRFAEKAAYERKIGPVLEVSPPHPLEEVENDVPLDVSPPESPDGEISVEDIPTEDVLDSLNKEVKDAN